MGDVATVRLGLKSDLSVIGHATENFTEGYGVFTEFVFHSLRHLNEVLSGWYPWSRGGLSSNGIQVGLQ